MPKRLRIGQPTGLWKEEMETGTNDPTILQAGNGRSTTEISVTQALDSLDSLDSPIGFSTCSQFAIFSCHPSSSLAIPYSFDVEKAGATASTASVPSFDASACLGRAGPATEASPEIQKRFASKV